LDKGRITIFLTADISLVANLEKPMLLLLICSAEMIFWAFFYKA